MGKINKILQEGDGEVWIRGARCEVLVRIKAAEMKK